MVIPYQEPSGSYNLRVRMRRRCASYTIPRTIRELLPNFSYPTTSAPTCQPPLSLNTKSPPPSPAAFGHNAEKPQTPADNSRISGIFGTRPKKICQKIEFSLFSTLQFRKSHGILYRQFLLEFSKVIWAISVVRIAKGVN